MGRPFSIVVVGVVVGVGIRTFRFTNRMVDLEEIYAVAVFANG